MKMVAAIIRGQQAVGMLWIARNLIEIDDSIKVARGANPLIHSLSVCLGRLPGVVVARSHKWRNRRADHFDAVRMSAHDHLLVCTDDVPDQRVVFGLGNVVIARERSNVVDSLKDHQVPHSGLRDYVVIESCQSVWPKPVEQQPISADAVIENRDIACAILCLQAFGEDIGPTIVAVCSGPMAVSNRIAQSDHRTRVGCSRDIHSADEVPVLDLFRIGKFGSRDQIAMNQKRRFPRTWMACLLRRRHIGVQRDCEI
jgi:hypothetical protein